MRKVLDGLYDGCMVLAAIGMLSILLAVTAQIIGRMFGLLVPSAPEIAGYSMAASTFLALAYTFRIGGHVRVSLLIIGITGRARKCVESGVLVLAFLLTTFFFSYMVIMTVETFWLGEVSGGVLAIPLWIPQSFISIGLFALVIAIVDDLVASARGKILSYSKTEPLDHP